MNPKNRADQKARNVVTGPNYLSLSKKSLARAEFKLKNMWVQQAEEWVKTNERSWEFGSFQDQVIMFKILNNNYKLNRELILSHQTDTTKTIPS
jgi:hypothetical protein